MEDGKSHNLCPVAASAVNFSTVANQSSVKNAGMILPQIYLFNFSGCLSRQHHVKQFCLWLVIACNLNFGL